MMRSMLWSRSTAGSLERTRHQRGFAASSVPEAQALIRTHRPEIAILDVMIGNDTGIHLAQFITDEAPATKSSQFPATVILIA